MENIIPHIPLSGRVADDVQSRCGMGIPKAEAEYASREATYSAGRALIQATY